jgi:hypothetical protein
MADEADQITNERLRSGGTPIKGREIPKSEPSGGAPVRPAPAAAPAPAPAAKPPQALIDKAMRALDDPNAPVKAKMNASRVLADAGLIDEKAY